MALPAPPEATLPVVMDARGELQEALERCSVNRTGLIGQLAEIAATGETVTIIQKGGEIVSTKVVRDPQVRMKAIDKLSSLLDRLEGRAPRRKVTFEEMP